MIIATLPALIALGAACGDGADTAESPAPWEPDIHCPGDPSGACPDNDGALSAGAAAVPITPTCFESWVDANDDGEYHTGDGDTFLDCGCDRICPTDEGWTAADEGEGDGVFQAVWMAGFQTGRPAMEVHDDLWARAIVLDQGGTRLAIVELDLVGWFHDDVVATRELLAAAGIDVDYLLVGTTHVHEGPDTIGMWGERVGESGYQEDYAAYVRQQSVEAVRRALADLRPVGSVRAGEVDASTRSDKGVRNLVRDSRDPVIIDEQVGAARLLDQDGQPIATLVSWGNHPESLSDENDALTSDYVHYLREGVEQGVSWAEGDHEGLGGTAIFLEGMVGGLMTPLGVTCTDGDGVDQSQSNFDKAACIGRRVAEMAIDAVADGEDLADPRLSFKVSVFDLPVENRGFQAMTLMGVLDRPTYGWDPDRDIGPDNIPCIRTEIAQIQLGSLAILSVPGELLPELAIGGYDGSHVGSTIDEFISSDNPNPPDVSKAPAGPYYRELLDSPHAWILGLGNDEVGYIIPDYDFVLDDGAPYLVEAEGDHYEETNSLGPRTAPILDEQVHRLLDW